MLLRSGIIVALFTLLSRIFGLARELFVAYLFGAGSSADAVNVSFKLPNLFRRIFAEGALSAAFIPIFNFKLQDSSEESRRFSSKILTLLLSILIILVTLMELYMPLVMKVLAPGFQIESDKFDLTVRLCRITMPYIIFISVASLLGGMLNSIKKFAAFAFLPVILSASIVLLSPLFFGFTDNTSAVSISVIFAGLLQCIFMFGCLWRSPLRISLNFNIKDKDVLLFCSNMLPATLSAGVYQLNLFISQSIASFLPGAVSILSYADRIYQFPLSIIGITFGTVLLPELSVVYKNRDYARAATLQANAIKLGLFLSIPAAIGIIILSHPIIHVIYERGAFRQDDTASTAEAISAFALGLPAFVISKILTPIFYANSDTKTPFKVTLYSLTLNCILNILLMHNLGHVGIALGSSISAWLGVVLLYFYVKKYGFTDIFDSDMKSFMIKFCISCIITASFLKITTDRLIEYLYDSNLWIKCTSLFGIILATLCVLLCLSFVFKIYNVLGKDRSNILQTPRL